MTHNRSTDAVRDPWRASLRASRDRRAAASRARRWSLRRRSVTVCACAVMALGGGVAMAGNGGTNVQSSDNAGAASATLKPGTSGPAVKRLQRKLGVTATGFYGKLTKSAVKRFQRRTGLKADGVAGPTTLARLGLPTAQEASSRPGQGSDVAVPDVLRRIAQCESGGDPTAVSADGRYRGKYQFDMDTWTAMGGSGDPAEAPESVQDRLAIKLYRQRGTAPWGRCANA
jgi:hypothetical protein